MIQDNIHLQHYIAETGRIFIRKGDVRDPETGLYPTATDEVWIGRNDSIDNFEEIEE